MSETKRHRGLVRIFAVLLAFVLIAAGCGDDDDDVSSSGDSAEATEAPAEATEAPAEETEAPAEETEAPAEETEAPAEETEAPAEETEAPAADDLTAAAQTAAAEAGDPVELPTDVTVGYLQWIYADEAGKRIEDAAKEAVEFLGWDYITCDAAGDPNAMPPCGNQLLDQGADVIFTDGIPEAFITDVLERAESEGVPVISAGGEVDPRDYYVASYASDDTDLGVQLATYLNELLPDGGRILVQTFPSAWSAKRQAGLAATINENIEIVESWEPDPANLIEGTAADVTSKLEQYGDIDALWIDFSVASIGAATALDALYPDPADPARPKILTFYANPGTVQQLLTGQVSAAVDEKLEWQSWAQADAIAALLARATEPSQERAPTYGGLNFSSRQVISSENVPADGVIPPPPPGDYAAFFKAKWCAEYTNIANCG